MNSTNQVVIGGGQKIDPATAGIPKGSTSSIVKEVLREKNFNSLQYLKLMVDFFMNLIKNLV